MSDRTFVTNPQFKPTVNIAGLGLDKQAVYDACEQAALPFWSPKQWTWFSQEFEGAGPSEFMPVVRKFFDVEVRD